MALFQRRPAIYNQNLPYTISFSKTALLVVGLGNPGKKYDLTRHNFGFMVINNFAKDNEFEDFALNRKLKGYITERVLGSNRVVLFKPDTFMNLSGQAVRLVQDYFKIEPKNVLVIYDELSLDFGTIRSRMGGQSAGHNGVKSLIEQLGNDFSRLRLGINNELAKNKDASDFVLTKFSKTEQGDLPAILNEASNMLTEFVFDNGNLAEQTRTIDVGR